MQKIQDIKFLKLALRLAARGLSFTNPNPMVGAVIVKNNKIIAEGYHKARLKPHAEVEALNKAGSKAAGSTMYLNLEPHSYFSHNPPCTLAIIKSGVKRVVIATLDPNLKVNGRGVKQLRAAKIKVDIINEIAAEAQKLNEAYFCYHNNKRPWVLVKYAASLDGKIATRTNDSKWITNEELRAYTRKLRGSYQTILVGVNTVLADNPHLGARNYNRRDPVRIILDGKLRIPLNSKVLRDNNIIIATTTSADKTKKKLLLKRGVELMIFKSSEIPVKPLLKKLYDKNILSVLVEGGGEVIGSFFDNKLVDKVLVCLAPIIIGGRDAKNAVAGRGVNLIKNAPRLSNEQVTKFGDNLLISGYVA